jgi:hypothetical protein
MTVLTCPYCNRYEVITTGTNTVEDGVCEGCGTHIELRIIGDRLFETCTDVKVRVEYIYTPAHNVLMRCVTPRRSSRPNRYKRSR